MDSTSCSTQRCAKRSGLIVVVAVAEPFFVGGAQFFDMSRNWWTFVAEFQPRPAIIAGGLYYGGQWGVGRKPLFINNNNNNNNGFTISKI